ncbi:uncharacterized protein LOC127751069 [Frankliniella occidentalis]|uniref:Uncharacterized protein LOC127751069 n=1 Tax=Frankliniella occidentalis TaxID=133901 RepID=A0A9C6XT12_FRAOC|nr:uncharacterized protein LOC127751069 [Frankliniella occidentalis]
MSLLPEVNSVTDINPLEEGTLLHSPGSHRNVGDLDIASEPGSDDDPSYGKNNEMRSEENSFGFGSPKGDALGPSGEGAFGSQSDNSLQPSDDGFDDSEGGSHQDGDDQSVEGDLDSSGPDDASSISDEALKVRKSSKRDKKEEDELVSIVLMKLTQKLDAVSLNQAVIIRAVDPDMAKVIRPAEFPHTPLAKVKHFAKLEKFLKNATNFAAMRDKMWMSIGGCGDERKATGRILTDLFQYSCAKDVSWGGSKGMKCAFGQSETCKALFGAIGMAYKGTDLTQCELKIKDWFRTAPAAYERLMKRKMSKQ